MEDLRRKTELIAKGGLSNKNGQDEIEPVSDDVRKMKKENMNYQETINRLVAHLLSQPGHKKVLGLSEEMTEKIQQ